MPADLKEAYQTSIRGNDGVSEGDRRWPAARADAPVQAGYFQNPSYDGPAPNQPDFGAAYQMGSQPYLLEQQRTALKTGLSATQPPPVASGANGGSGGAPCQGFWQHVWNCPECRQKLRDLFGSERSGSAGGAGMMDGYTRAMADLMQRMQANVPRFDASALLYYLLVLLVVVLLVDALLRWRR